MTLADRIVVLKDGTIQQMGTPLEIYDAPANRFVAEFVGTLNLVRADEASFAALAAQAPAGAHIAFRPHSVLVAAQPGGDACHWVASEVTEREFLGEFVRYRLRAGPHEFIADQPHTLGNAGFAPGARVSLGIDRTQVRVLQA
jgi:iron(III) transport system ATP-binding protein